MFDRTIKLIGNDNYFKLKNSNVLIIGLGGVGGYALEALVRSGIENITIVDYDKIDITNLNRQIISTNDNIGNLKTDEWKKRILTINSNVKIKIINEKINENNIYKLFEEDYDFIVDACDTMIVKKLLIKNCNDKNINLITVCGMGRKLDPTMVEIIPLSKTSYDPIAKVLRKYAKDEKITNKVMCICSKERPLNSDKDVIASMIMVPSTAGVLAAYYVIKNIIKIDK